MGTPRDHVDFLLVAFVSVCHFLSNQIPVAKLLEFASNTHSSDNKQVDQVPGEKALTSKVQYLFNLGGYPRRKKA